MGEILKKYFYNKDELTEKEVKFAKKGFVIDAVCENCSANWAGGTYFVGLLACLGASEATSSFIMSLGIIASVCQLLTPYIMRKRSFKKPLVYGCKFFMRPAMAFAFFLPFIFGRSMTSIVLAAICYFSMNAAANISSAPSNIWLMDCIEKGGRAGKYFGIRYGIIHITLAIAFFVAAYITRTYSGEREGYSYLVFGILAMVICIGSFVVLFFIKEPYVKKEPEKVNLLKEFKEMVVSKRFRSFFVYGLIFDFGNQIGGLISEIYLIQRMGIGLEFLSYRTVADLILRSILSFGFGKLGDRIGMKKVLQICVAVWSINWLCYAFMDTSNVYVLVIITVFLSAITNGGHGLASQVYMFECMPEEKRSSFLVCRSSLSLLINYIISLCVTFYLSRTESFSLNMIGHTFDNMNVLFIISTIFVAASVFVLFINFDKSKE